MRHPGKQFLSFILVLTILLLSGPAFSADIKLDLKTAAFEGLTEEVKTLLYGGTDINAADSDGETRINDRSCFPGCFMV